MRAMRWAAIIAVTGCLAGGAYVRGAAAQDPGPLHAIKIDGTPKYGPDFTHFDYVNPDAPKGGEIRLAAYGSFDNLNPFILRGISAIGAGLVFETLTVSSNDEVFAEYGQLAETIAVAPDKASVTFVLRSGARFHDGRPVTAEDVAWSFETLKAKGHPQYRTYYADVLRAETEGDRTIRFVFRDGGNKELPAILGSLPVLPKHVFQSRDFEQTTLDPIIGSGPYRVEKVDPGRSITYARIEDWWGRDLPVNKGQYNFDRIRYDYYRDFEVAFEGFKAGAYDYRLEASSKTWVTGYDLPQVKTGAIVREEYAHEDPVGLQCFAFNLRRPVFADIRVREGINHLFDYNWLRKTMSYGLFQRATSYFNNSELASRGLPAPEELAILEPYRGKVPDEVFTKEYKPPETDGSGNLREHLRVALGLFKDAGWELRGNKLVNVQTGEPMRFEFLLNEDRFERFVQPFVRNLARAGIEASIRIVDTAQYTYRMDHFDFDITVESFPQSLSPGNEQRDFWNSQRADQPGSRNTIGIKNPVVDDLVEKLINAPDRASLIAHTRALDRVLLWNWYVVPQWFDGINRVAYWNRFGHPTLSPKYNGPLVVTTWWLDAEKEAKVAPVQRRGVN